LLGARDIRGRSPAAALQQPYHRRHHHRSNKNTTHGRRERERERERERGKILQAFSLRADSSLEAVSPAPPSANETFNAASLLFPRLIKMNSLFLSKCCCVLCIVLDSLQSAARILRCVSKVFAHLLIEAAFIYFRRRATCEISQPFFLPKFCNIFVCANGLNARVSRRKLCNMLVMSVRRASIGWKCRSRYAESRARKSSLPATCMPRNKSEISSY
jgi:hypothetical protein